MPPSSATPLNGPPIAGKSIKRLPISAGQYRGSEIMVPSSGKRKVLLRKMAYDHLCVPAMSSETERCFRGTKLGIPETRKRLDWAVMGAGEVSRGLMRYGVL